MGSNILITGAAGYIGGSIVADFLSSKSPLLKGSHIFAVARSDEQAKAIAKSGATVLQLDLLDENAVAESMLKHNIDIIIHCASSLNASLALSMVTALGKQKQDSGKQTYFIHTSGLSAFYAKTGWPTGAMKDSGPIFETEKEHAESFPIRMTDVAVTEHAKALGVTSFIVVPSTVYGRGSGEWNQLSVILPVMVQGSISQKAVSKFHEDISVPGVHIADLTALYGTIVEKILRRETIPNGTEGYYFALAHTLTWWKTLDHLALALKARGLVASSQTSIWSSDEAAAEALGIPAMFVQILWSSGAEIIAENAQSIGWKPEWDEARFLENIDDEIRDVLELGKAKSSLIDSLFEAAKA